MYKVKVENINQLETTLELKNVNEIILARDSFSENDLPKLVDKITKEGKIAWILMERISRYEEKMYCSAMMSGRTKKQNAKKSHYEQGKLCRGEHCEPESLRLSTDNIYAIKNLDGIIVQNIDSFAYMLRKINMAANDKLMVELNYTMNCYNRETKTVFETLYNKNRTNAIEKPLLFTAPVELNIYELSDVGYDTFLVYSYIDTMVSANCLYKNTHNSSCLCGDNQTLKYLGKGLSNGYTVEHYEPANSFYILDRKNKKLHYKTYCKYCYNRIFNVEPLYLIDKIEEIGAHIARPYEAKKARPYSVDTDKKNVLKYRIDFSFENDEEVKNILKGIYPDSFTRGHYKKSIN